MKTKTIGILSLTAVMLVAMMTVPAMAYTIDGDLDDWGLSTWYDGLNNGDESNWVPTSPTCDWIVEDNIDGITHPGYRDWTGYSATGVHIQGQGTSYDTYAELKITDRWSRTWAQPVGGEAYDIEALYFDSDATTAYFAIVASISESTMGDLALDIDGSGGYEYGIVLQGGDKGKVYQDPTWSKPRYFPSSEPYRIRSGTITDTAEVEYVNSNRPDNDCDNYIIEISVPRSALGSPSSDQLSNLHATMSCGNDEIEIEGVSWEAIPEFATIAIPVGIIFGLFYFYRRKRQSKEE